LSKIEEWDRWLKSKLWNDAVTMLVNRDVWTAQAEVFRSNPDLPRSYYWTFLRKTYVDSQVLAVRRMVGRRRDEQSLRAILQGLADQPELLTFEDYRSRYKEHERRHARKDWTDSFGEPVDGHVDPTVPRQAVDKLDSALAVVKRYANDHVAHAAVKPRTEGLSIDELDEAIDAVHEAFRACILLVRGGDFKYHMPIGPGWDRVFDHRWRRSSAS
jgi:Asp-tRNA(Asn)/Glu-tRNA(Gln) amidotransferase A subunit family amidase